MKIAVVQYDITWEQQQENYRKVTSLLEGIDADVIALPELFSTGHTLTPTPFMETENGPTATFLAECAQTHNSYIIGSYIQRTEDKPLNSVVIFNPEGESVLTFSKMHLISLEKENQVYQHGKKVEVVEIHGHLIGVVVCYDLRFPNLFRTLRDKGAVCVFVISNWPTNQRKHWEILLRARAIEHQMFIVGVNRIGNAPTGDCSGESMIVDPSGNIVAAAGHQEEVLTATIDLSVVEKFRTFFPITQDRKPIQFWEKFPL